MPGLAAGVGFVLDNTGSVTFASNVNTNGTATIRNGAGGTMTFNQYEPLNNSSMFTNQGQVAFLFGFATDNGTLLDNSGTMTVATDFVPNGTVINTGRITVGGSLTTNSGAVIRNRCSIVVTGGFTNNADLGLSVLS